MSLEPSLQAARRSLWEFFADEGGGTLSEYGLVAALIAFAIFGIVASMGDSVNIAFTGVNSDLENATINVQPAG